MVLGHQHQASFVRGSVSSSRLAAPSTAEHNPTPGAAALQRRAWLWRERQQQCAAEACLTRTRHVHFCTLCPVPTQLAKGSRGGGGRHFLTPREHTHERTHARSHSQPHGNTATGTGTSTRAHTWRAHDGCPVRCLPLHHLAHDLNGTTRSQACTEEGVRVGVHVAGHALQAGVRRKSNRPLSMGGCGVEERVRSCTRACALNLLYIRVGFHMCA